MTPEHMNDLIDRANDAAWRAIQSTTPEEARTWAEIAKRILDELKRVDDERP